MESTNSIVKNAVAATKGVASNAFDPMSFFNQGQREREELFAMKRQLIDLVDKFYSKMVAVADDYENAADDLARHPDVPNAKINERIARGLESKLTKEFRVVDAFLKELVRLG